MHHCDSRGKKKFRKVCTKSFNYFSILLTAMLFSDSELLVDIVTGTTSIDDRTGEAGGGGGGGGNGGGGSVGGGGGITFPLE